MAQHEIRLHLADHIDQPEFRVPVHFKRVVAQIEEPDVVNLQSPGRIFGLDPPRRLDLFQRHALLLPQLGAFASFAVGQANNGNVIPKALVQGDRPAAAPDKIGRMRGNHHR